ncbi:hypothetical protein R6Q59_001461 [Mikania micrantha]
MLRLFTKLNQKLKQISYVATLFTKLNQKLRGYSTYLNLQVNGVEWKKLHDAPIATGRIGDWRRWNDDLASFLSIEVGIVVLNEDRRELELDDDDGIGRRQLSTLIRISKTIISEWDDELESGLNWSIGHRSTGVRTELELELELANPVNYETLTYRYFPLFAIDNYGGKLVYPYVPFVVHAYNVYILVYLDVVLVWSHIHFHEIPDHVIDKLIEEGLVLRVAGALIIEHPLLVPFVKDVKGTIDSVMGLPKALTEKLLKEAAMNA